MNILPIINLQNNNLAKRSTLNNRTVIQPKYSNTLDRDTVSFTGGEKVLGMRTKEVSMKLATSVYDETLPHAKKVLNTLKRGLKDLVESEKHPENPILSGNSGIKGRVKTPASIAEKAISRGKYSKSEIANIGDIAGFRIVLRSSTQNDFDKVFTNLGEMVKHGELKIKEIENYRLTSTDSYVSAKTLDKFEAICQKNGQFPTQANKPIPNGYTAVHLTIEMPNGQLGEIQIMGKDVEILKELEDFYYKIRCKKDFDKKYKLIQEIMKEKLSKLDDFQKETLNRYIKDSYIHAKVLPPKATKGKTSAKDFLPIPYSLPEDLGFANLQKLKEACDRAAKMK